jgi:tetratricopeptide (TPR) repeat protein
MSREDWYRSSDWNEVIAQAFFAKLRRARDKSQYLRIQASYLAEKHPDVSLDVIDQYFALGDHFDLASAHLVRATAFLSLGSTDEAIAAYEAALAQEQLRPNLLTEAYIQLPFLVATQELEAHYQRAIFLLDEHKQRLIFPVDRFRWDAAQALIALAQGRSTEAAEYSRRALATAAEDHSGFRYHPNVGLVGKSYDLVRARLSRAAA